MENVRYAAGYLGAVFVFPADAGCAPSFPAMRGALPWGSVGPCRVLTGRGLSSFPEPNGVPTVQITPAEPMLPEDFKSALMYPGFASEAFDKRWEGGAYCFKISKNFGNSLFSFSVRPLDGGQWEWGERRLSTGSGSVYPETAPVTTGPEGLVRLLRVAVEEYR